MFGNFRQNNHNPQHNAISVYKQHFSAYSSAFHQHPKRVNGGGRVLLPMDCLQEISQLNLVYPLQFQLNAFNGRKAFAGVLEFEAEGGQIIMPDWLFEQLALKPGDAIRVQTVVLPQGGLVKLRPHSRRFIELSNPKQLLEKHFTQYPVLYKGSTIVLNYLDEDFLLDILDTQDVRGKTVEAISTVSASATFTELKVDFDRPLDMPESPVAPPPQTAAFPTGAANVIGGQSGVQFTPLQFKAPSLLDDKKTDPAPSAAPPEAPAFVPFASAGRTLSGRAPPPNPAAAGKAPPTAAAAPTAPATGTTTAQKPPQPSNNNNNSTSEPSSSFKAFGGSGRTLR